ncbi:Mbov_0400 family ICE element protein [Mycoplasma seminis]|uniref:Uncharacterized protein n=1 Tax=Mycoplasma seminis TaxID=512749 RepID=A0ABY9HBB7_9MOLU|nr:hypothetical protein [Mycoplasma seminis]WLP85899.1 hypothetical protein Q8852_02010 [Mycoplasma seminis]
MQKDRLKIIWKSEKEYNYYTNSNDSISFNSNGKRILAHSKGFNFRPVIIFEIGENTYYLNTRSANKNKFQFPFEISINKNDDDLNNKLRNTSWVDTSNIQVMKTKYFHKFYDENQFNTINDLPSWKQEEILNSIYYNLRIDNVSIQEIKINNQYKAYSYLIKRSFPNEMYNAGKYNFYKNIIIDFIKDELNIVDRKENINQKDEIKSDAWTLLHEDISNDNFTSNETFKEDFNTENETNIQEGFEVDDDLAIENSNVDYLEHDDKFFQTKEDNNSNEDIQTEENLNEAKIKTEQVFEEKQQEKTIIDGDVEDLIKDDNINDENSDVDTLSFTT